MQIIHILTILAIGFIQPTQIESALPPLPDNLKVDSHVNFLDDRDFLRLKVTEYVNIQDGSIRLEITNQNDNNNATKMSFFRLMSNNDREDRLIDRSLIAHSPDTGKCSSVHIEAWPLKDLSRLLLELATTKNLAMGVNENIPNRTFLGPTSLLRLVYSNTAAFKLFSQSRDELGDKNEFHFSLLLNNWNKPNHLVARLLVTISADNLNTEDGNLHKYMIGKTTLSQVDATSHLSRITLAILDQKSKRDKEKEASLNKRASAELLNELYMTNSKLVEQLTVSYRFIQEQSLSRHTGLDHLSDEVDDPFMMPVGLGCGSFSSNKHFFVKATQFSGQFVANDYEGQFYVAYDETSNHLRYDILGKSKMIYALDDNSVTYIATDSTGKDDAELKGVQESGMANSSSPAKLKRSGETRFYYDKSHCAQASLLQEPGPTLKGPSVLSNKKKLDSILGLGEAVQLTYLGQMRLPTRDRNGLSATYEPITCQVFERAVPVDQVPALVQMHLRLRPGGNNELYLVYYFVDEIDSRTRQSLFNEKLNPSESMWLKRIELFSRNAMSKYIFSCGQITFSKSSWSLETVGEDTRNRETQLEHPVRSFDTLECWTERNAVQLDVVLTQQNPDEWKRKGLEFTHSRVPVPLIESFEETIMTFLSRQIGFARSRVNEFTLQPKAADNFESIMVRSKVTFPFSYFYEEKLIGWVDSYWPLLFRKQAVMVSRKCLVLLHECSLNLATRLGGRYKFHMMYCPNFGCGLLLVDPLELEKDQQAGASNKTNFHSLKSHKGPQYNLAVYNELCQIYSVSKAVQPQGLVSPEQRAELVSATLDRAAVSIESYQLDPKTKEFKATPYRAQVSKVFVVSGKSLQSYEHDERIIAHVCYTTQTRLLKDMRPMELAYGNGSLVIKELIIDRHHSQAHCRKACILFEHCETYSYNHADRRCVLTNILPGLLIEDEIIFENLLTSLDQCGIYALDQLVRFKRSPTFTTRRPADMIQSHGDGSTTSVVLWANLGECARSAHSSYWSLSKRPDQHPLSSFGFMRLKNLCLIYNTNREEFLKQFSSAKARLIGNPADLERFIGSAKDQVLEPESYETYNANSAQFYKTKFGYYMDITSDAMPSDERLKLENQDYERCLDACISKVRDCATVDYCSYVNRGKSTRECFLWPVRSPYAIDSLRKAKDEMRFAISPAALKLKSSLPEERFTQLEEELYVEGRGESKVVVKISHHCQHFYLTGDNLYLKRLLSQGEKEANLGGLDRVSNARNSLALRETAENERQFSSAFGWSVCLQLFLGLTVGFGIFIVQPAITDLITRRQVSQGVSEVSNQRIDEIRRALRPGSWRRQQPSRPAQRDDSHEMVRIGS